MLLPFFAPAATAAEVVLKQKELTARQARLTHGEDLYNELCAVCHGVSGVGDGPAVPALNQPPLDLTHLAVNNDGVFPREHLEESIYGRSRIKAHGTLDMPVWGRAFEFTKPDWSRMRRVKFAKHRINKIVDYIETLQAE
jgi:mono/diheme cytochrome c family protein